MALSLFFLDQILFSPWRKPLQEGIRVLLRITINPAKTQCLIKGFPISDPMAFEPFLSATQTSAGEVVYRP
jgi:hypothetical protein